MKKIFAAVFILIVTVMLTGAHAEEILSASHYIKAKALETMGAGTLVNDAGSSEMMTANGREIVIVIPLPIVDGTVVFPYYIACDQDRVPNLEALVAQYPKAACTVYYPTPELVAAKKVACIVQTSAANLGLIFKITKDYGARKITGAQLKVKIDIWKEMTGNQYVLDRSAEASVANSFMKINNELNEMLGDPYSENSTLIKTAGRLFGKKLLSKVADRDGQDGPYVLKKPGITVELLGLSDKGNFLLYKNYFKLKGTINIDEFMQMK